MQDAIETWHTWIKAGSAILIGGVTTGGILLAAGELRVLYAMVGGSW